ncbi:kinase-like protein, partial [Pseudovirgaria hyperparasitica]
SSKSPAGAFLSLWARDDSASKAELDEEGQEIDKTGYIIGRQIGVGGFSVVKEVFNLENGIRRRRAVKIVRKQVSGKGEDENEKVQAEFEHEVSIWRYVNHKYILPLIECFETPFATFCITKLNEGGTLFDLIHARRKAGAGGLPSSLAKRYVYQLASAIRFLHEDVHVVHRDIKIENVLIDMSDPNAACDGGNILLCDFGMADFVYNEHRLDQEPFDQEMHIGPSHTSTSVTGSLRYAAPELLESPCQLYSTAVDMWAFGNVVYAMLMAQLAFNDPFEPRVVMQILNGEWDEAPLYKTNAVLEEGSTEPVEMVKGCLQKNPEERWTIADVLRSTWL